jgi:hypothetical protein
METKPIRANVRRHGAAVLLDCGIPELPRTIEFDGKRWVAKSEIHVTLVGNESLRILSSKSGLSEPAQIEDALSYALRRIRFLVRPLDEFWRLREERAETIVQRAEVEGGESFFARLEERLETTVERPPYHLTLYCSGTVRGIGVATTDQLHSIGMPLTAIERENLRRLLGPPAS